MTNRILQLIALLGIGAATHAADPGAKPVEEKQIINITSTDGFEYDLQLGTAVYTGNVRVDDPTMRMTCQKLSVKFKPKDGDAEKFKGVPLVTGDFGGTIESIEATGSVVILNKKDKSTASGEKAVYTTTNQTIVLSGNRPNITSGNNGLKADRVIFDRARGKFRAEGNIESFLVGTSLFSPSTRPPTLMRPLQ